jgi:Rrf2 family protein
MWVPEGISGGFRGMLSLTRKTDYALIALTHLAAEEDRLSSAREISDLYRIPLPVLTNILKTLTRAGMVESVRGAKGGYRLAEGPGAITLASLVLAIEGPVRLVACSGERPEGKATPCELMAWCPVRSPAKGVHDKLQRFLEDVTLAEIVEGCRPATGTKREPCAGTSK